MQRIENGTYAKGSLMPTEIDLATEFSASRGTVSKALTSLVHLGFVERKPRVGTRVLDFDVSAPERKLDLDAYAFIYPGENHPAIWEIVSGFHEAAQSAGERTLLLSSGSDFEKEPDLLEHLSSFNVKAVAVYPLIVSLEQQHRIESALLQCPCPVILAGAILPRVDVPVVLGDGFDAAYTMTQYLLQRGCKTIGFLSEDSLCTSIRDRYMGYTKALQNADRSVDARHVLQLPDIAPNFENPLEGCVAQARAWMQQAAGGELPDAVVCAHDYLAQGCLVAAQEKGLSVPGDLSVAGIGGYAHLNPEDGPVLTTYKIPYKKIGNEVFLRLQRLSSGEDLKNTDAHLYLKGSLVSGDTA